MVKTQAEPELTFEEKEKQALVSYEKTINDRTDLNDKEKQILIKYNAGEQLFKIAKDVYEFVNSDTVGTVVLTVRKEHADDYSDVENIESTKGYTGV